MFPVLAAVTTTTTAGLRAQQDLTELWGPLLGLGAVLVGLALVRLIFRRRG